MRSPPFYRSIAFFWCVVLYTFVVSLWTTEAIAPWQHKEEHNAWHHYEYLVDGFLAGHTYLSLEPDPKLLALKDPFDATTNISYRLWDATLFKGKYYLYYGPTPALILMLPYKVLTGHMMPQRVAIGLFGCFGLLALATITLYLRKTYFPDISWGWTTFVYFVIAHACWMPVLLRRPGFWELPITSALALAWWGLFCLFKCLENPRLRIWHLCTGLCFGLLLGCRPTYLFGVTIITLIYLYVNFKRIKSFQCAFLFLVPIVLSGIGLLIYNYERFGSVTEFGQSYQLWGFEDRTIPLFSLRYFFFNVWIYFFSTPELSLYFPFFRSVSPAQFPQYYIGIEEMHGIIIALPVLFLGWYGAATLWKSSHKSTPLAYGFLCSLALTVASAGVLFCFGGACSRYIPELIIGWIPLSIYGIFVFIQKRRPLTLLILSFWSILYTLLASAEHRAFFRTTNPTLYTFLARNSDYPSEWYFNHTKQQFGPYLLTVALPPLPKNQPAIVVLIENGGINMLNQVALHRLTSTKATIQFIEDSHVRFETKPFNTASQLQVLVNTPWLYPPPEHPFWDQVKDTIERTRLQTWFIIETVEGDQDHYSTFFFDALRTEPRITTHPNAVGFVVQARKLPFSSLFSTTYSKHLSQQHVATYESN